MWYTCGPKQKMYSALIAKHELSNRAQVFCMYVHMYLYMCTNYIHYQQQRHAKNVQNNLKKKLSSPTRLPTR